MLDLAVHTVQYTAALHHVAMLSNYEHKSNTEINLILLVSAAALPVWFAEQFLSFLGEFLV